MQAQADLGARLAARLRGDDFEPDEILAEAYKMRFKLPHLFLDDLRRALLPVPVKIAKCSDDFHAVDPSCSLPTKWPGATAIAPGQSFATSPGGFVILGRRLSLGVDPDVRRRSVRLVFGTFAGLVDPGLGLIVRAVVTGVPCDLFENDLLFVR